MILASVLNGFQHNCMCDARNVFPLIETDFGQQCPCRHEQDPLQFAPAQHRQKMCTHGDCRAATATAAASCALDFIVKDFQSAICMKASNVDLFLCQQIQ